MHWRLFDFARVDAEVAFARGAEAEALAAYRATVLHATEQVETGFVLWSKSLSTIEALTEAEAALQAARDAEDSAYRRGASSALDVLALDLRLIRLQQRTLAARALALHSAAAVFTAMGGGWAGAASPALD